MTTGDDQTDRSGTQTGSDETAKLADSAGGRGQTGSSDRTTKLFRCESCDVTLISEDLASCPRCGDGVETVPTEDEAGIV